MTEEDAHLWVASSFVFNDLYFLRPTISGGVESAGNVAAQSMVSLGVNALLTLDAEAVRWDING